MELSASWISVVLSPMKIRTLVLRPLLYLFHFYFLRPSLTSIFFGKISIYITLRILSNCFLLDFVTVNILHIKFSLFKLLHSSITQWQGYKIILPRTESLEVKFYCWLDTHHILFTWFSIDWLWTVFKQWLLWITPLSTLNITFLLTFDFTFNGKIPISRTF